MLEVSNLTITYGQTTAAADISFTVKQGEVLAIVGSSGSGKTTILRSLIGCLPPSGKITSGQIVLQQQSLNQCSAQQWQGLRGNTIAMLFQNSLAMLNPVRTIGSQFRDYLQAHTKLAKLQAQALAEDMLAKVNLAPAVLQAYPFELSGGMGQRVGLAMALALNPALLLADEPTSALDGQTQLAVLQLLRQTTAGGAVIMVTHNLGLAAHLADKILVMDGGRMVEYGFASQLLRNPQQEYTKQLLAAIPCIGGKKYYAEG